MKPIDDNCIIQNMMRIYIYILYIIYVLLFIVNISIIRLLQLFPGCYTMYGTALQFCLLFY